MAHRMQKGSTKHLTVSKLSRLAAKDLREMDCLKFVVNKKHETLAVLIPYSQYCEMQREVKRLTKEADDFAQDANFLRGAR
jgi:hypothetical protein